MPALPTFQPGRAPGVPAANVQSSYAGENVGSWMQQAQNRRIQAQQADQQKQKFYAELPAIIAKSHADQLTSAASVAVATQQEQLRAKAAVDAGPANDEFNSALTLSDWDAQESELGRIQAKYGYMAGLKEYEPFTKAVDQARTNALKRLMINQQIEAHQTAVETQAQAGIDKTVEQQAGATERANVTADASRHRTDVTEQRTELVSQRAARDNQYKAFMASALQSEKAYQKALADGQPEQAQVFKKSADNFRGEAAKMMVQPEKTTFDVPNVTSKPANDGLAPNAQTLQIIQSQVDSGQLSADQARGLLTALGFKRKE